MRTVFRITVRGLAIELRGQFHDLGDEDQPSVQNLADALAPFGMVIASHAPDDYDPFAISDPENPPTHEKSKELIQSWFDTADADHRDELIDYLAHIHFNQALVIRGERGVRDAAERELHQRELHHFETEQVLDQIRNYIDRFQEEDGWHGDIEDIRAFLGKKVG